MDEYERRGYGRAGIGFGKRVGIAVVDFQLAFTDTRFPLGGAELTDRAVNNTATLLHAARAARLRGCLCWRAQGGLHGCVPVRACAHPCAECGAAT